MLKASGWIALFVGVGVLVAGGIASYVLVPCWGCVITPNRYHQPPPRGYERSRGPWLKTLASAQADFRANDRDGNGVNEFWRKDVAGLYGGTGGDGKPLKLIELSVALADDAPKTSIAAFGTSGPKYEYWFRAIRHEDEDPQKLDPQRFAFAAIPVDFPRHGKYVFIIDENNTIFRSDKLNLNVTVFPKDLSTWTKLD